MTEDLRGQFFIVKGQFLKTTPIEIGDDTVFVGGYDPYNTDTKEWYQLVYRPLYTCVACGKDLDLVLQGGEHFMKTFKGQRKKVDKHFEHLRLEGHLTTAMSKVFSVVDDLFGDYFENEVCDMEDHVYNTMVCETPIKKAQKLMSKSKGVDVIANTVGVLQTEGQPKNRKTSVKFGVRKLLPV